MEKVDGTIVQSYPSKDRCRLMESPREHSERSFLLPIPGPRFVDKNCNFINWKKIKSIQLVATISTTYALKRVQPYFVAAIVGTILFPAVGIFAIINSVKAKYAKLDEDFDDTIKFSRYSYIFGRLAIFLGLTFYTAIVLVCLYLVGLWSFGTGAIFDKNRLKSLIKTLIFEPIKDRPPAEWFSAAHSICNFTREA